MRITHNIPALNARRRLGDNNKAVSKNLEKLSSGMKINRASDDAAGLAISEKMRGQIRGLEMAGNNSTDAISLIQTAEGSLNETHAILKRMQELAVQSTNGTYEESVDRVQLEKELVALKSEIDRIASSTHFNNKKLLNGDLGAVFGADGVAAAGANGHLASPAVKQVIRFPVRAPIYPIRLQANGVRTTGSAVPVTVAEEAAAPGSAVKSIMDLYNSSADPAHTNYVATSEGNEIVLTAKTAGVQPEWIDRIDGAVEDVSDVTVLGRDGGKGDVATKAKFTLDFDFAKLNGGEKITFGNMSITFINEPDTMDSWDDNYNHIVNIYYLKQEISDPDTDDYSERQLFLSWVGTILAGDGNVANGGETNTDISPLRTDGYPIERVTLKADNAGSGNNLNQIKISNADPAAMNGRITTVGKDAGKDTPATFATAALKINIKMLNVGDVLKFGTNELKILEDSVAAADVKEGEIRKSDLAIGNNFINKLEEIGATDPGKASYNATTKELTFIDTQTGRTAAAFTASLPIVSIGTTNADGTPSFPSAGVTFQIGANGGADQRVTLNIEDQSCSALGIGAISIASDSAANDALNLITDATNQVSGTRADLGAMQNRLEHTITNLGVSVENLTAAESRVRDADMAKEMMEMTKNNILSQASQAMLAQANTQPQGVLQLLQ